jgi:hypothetical protein
MPLLDGLAAVEERRWLALQNGGSGLAPPKGPAGSEPGRSRLYKRARWEWGQTRKVLRCQEELFRNLRPLLPRASFATS